jgi:Ribosomal protein L4
LKKPQTKDFLNILKVLGLSDKKSLLILGESNINVYLSSRNLKNSKVVIASELNTYSISNASNLIFDESAISGIINVLNK